MPAFDRYPPQPREPGVGAVAHEIPEGDRRDVCLRSGIARSRPEGKTGEAGRAGPTRRSRRLLETTKTELNAIAAPAISGLRNPRAASGMAAVLRRGRTRRRSGPPAAARAPCRPAPRSPAWSSGPAECRHPPRSPRSTSRPPAFTHPPATASPGAHLGRNRLPGGLEVSTAELPETTTPSVAIFSPGRTTNSSPTASLPTGPAPRARRAAPRACPGAQRQQRPQRRARMPLARASR